MDDLSQKPSLFGDDIFNQYDGNIAVPDGMVEKLKYSIESSEIFNKAIEFSDSYEKKAKISVAKKTDKKQENHTDNSNKKLFVPVFGKKQKNNSKKDDKSKVTKQKKFMPPAKISTDNLSQNFAPPVKNKGKFDKNSRGAAKNKSEKVSAITFKEKKSKVAENTTPPTLEKGMQKMETFNSFVGENYERQENANIKPLSNLTTKSKNSFHLGDVIFSSLNIVNDEDLDLSNSFIQETPMLDKISIQNLSLSQNKESFCSVTSLNKTYRNLDDKSFENIQVLLEYSQKDLEKKIPTGDDFLKLFHVIKAPKLKKYVRPTAMSTILGDMGPNKWYTDYIKQQKDCNNNNGTENEGFGEQIETSKKILEMYPKQNKHAVNMKK